MRKGVRRALAAGVVAGVAYAAWRVWQARVPPSDVSWESAPFPFPPVPRPNAVHVPREVEPGGGPETEAAGEARVEAWMMPNDVAECRGRLRAHVGGVDRRD